MAEAAMQEAGQSEDGKGLDPVSVGKVLKAARERAGYSRVEAEKHSGIGRHRLYRLERGVFLPRLDEIYALCSLYNLPVSAVMAGYAEEAGQPEPPESDADGGEQSSSDPDDPTAEAVEHLQAAASLLGLRVIPERSGEQSADAGIKVDPGEAISLEKQLDEVAAFAGGQPARVKASDLRGRLDSLFKRLSPASPEELIDAAQHRGIDVQAFDEALEGAEQSWDIWDEPDGIRGLDRGDLHDVLVNLLAVEAVYGVDPFNLALDRAKRLNEALGEALPDVAHDAETEVGVVPHGRKLTELLDDDRQVRNRMVREMLPYMVQAAENGAAESVVKALGKAGGAGRRKRKG
jgi:transcriptional regulator with XRE-family HTH domain